MAKRRELDAIGLAKKLGKVRIKDLVGHGIHPEYARRLVDKDIFVRASRGVYALADSEITEHHSFAILGKRIPKGVVCLTSALRFHSIGTQLPSKIWLAVEKGSAQPRLSYPPLSVVRFSGPAFTEGIGEHDIEGVMVRIYNPAKSVADCFKFRNRIGLEAAIEAARECLNERKASSDQIYHYAKICRVWNVMKPYLEALQCGI
jgi:predicted transcriptional regulator of viral defense system